MADIINVKVNGKWVGISSIEGIKGEDGHTPVKGVDYFTGEDKNEMVQMVIDTIGVAERGYY